MLQKNKSVPNSHGTRYQLLIDLYSRGKLYYVVSQENNLFSFRTFDPCGVIGCLRKSGILIGNCWIQGLYGRFKRYSIRKEVGEWN